MHTPGISVGLLAVLSTKTDGMSCHLGIISQKATTNRAWAVRVSTACTISCSACCHTLSQQGTGVLNVDCSPCRLSEIPAVVYYFRFLTAVRKKKKKKNLQPDSPACTTPPRSLHFLKYFNSHRCIFFMLSRCLLVHSNSCYYLYISACEQVWVLHEHPQLLRLSSSHWWGVFCDEMSRLGRCKVAITFSESITVFHIRTHYCFLFSAVMKLPVNLNDNSWDSVH